MGELEPVKLVHGVGLAQLNDEVAMHVPPLDF
jgi:hypothetical protein